VIIGGKKILRKMKKFLLQGRNFWEFWLFTSLRV